jgi:glycerophosphoryl diester phosphodiesterase
LGLLGLATSHLFLIHIAFQCSLGAAGVIVLILFLNPPMATPRGASPAVVDPIFQRPAPVLFAHRGGRLEVPESTERAFHHAVDALKVDVLELDVQLTKDGRFVVWHGPNLSNVVIDGIPSDPKRRTKAQNDIREYAWKDLDGKAFVADPLTRKSDDAFQHDRRLLLLEEALQKFPHTHINLVLKCRGFGGRIGAEHVADLVKILDAHRNGRTILVGSGSRAVLAELRKQTKGRYPTGLGLIEAIATMPKAALGFLSHPGMRGRALQTSHAGWVSPRWLVAEVQNAGGAVHVFLTGFPLTRNLDGTDPTATNLPPQEALHAVLARGVHGVMTDRPTRVKEMLATWRQRPGGGFPGA